MNIPNELMAEEARQSFFQVENITTYLDYKAFGIIAFDTILFSEFTYFFSPFSHWYCSGGPLLLFVSLILELKCVWPRNFDRFTADSTIKEYGTLGLEEASAHIAADYADLELDSLDIYIEKMIYLKFGLLSTIAAIIIEAIAFMTLMLGPYVSLFQHLFFGCD
jgi:hypothetical protein